MSAAPFCAIIGAGPAGLAAAEVLARSGARVTLYEHKPSPARKFLMAGRGGLNITHSEPLERFLTRYGAAAIALEPHIRAFSPERLRAFCAELGEETFVGSSGRVFPRSFKASPVLRAWLARLESLGVVFALRHDFIGLSGGRVLRLRGPSGDIEISPDAVILACGGASWPRLGSNGAWTAPLEAQGVSIAPLSPANCGALIDWSDVFLSAFEGQPIKTCLLRHGESSARGDVVVTKRGLEGGPVYALASSLRQATEHGEQALLSLDLRPDTPQEDLAQKLARGPGKQSLSTFLRKALGLSKLDVALLRETHIGGAPIGAEALATAVKQLPLRIRGVSGLERSISSSGGVCFSQLDDHLMLKQLPGVFVAGEMLDFDAPTGGYLLQAAFATGAAAGAGAARFIGLNTKT